jgi:hypothetical protein
MEDTVEIKTIYTLKGTGPFRTLMGGIDIIPDPNVKNGYKETKGDRIFISPMNYDDIRELDADAVIVGISCLQEETKSGGARGRGESPPSRKNA